MMKLQGKHIITIELIDQQGKSNEQIINVDLNVKPETENDKNDKEGQENQED